MRFCIIGKFPPIQGGTSVQTHMTAHELAKRGHDVFVVTNADEVTADFRQMFLDNDRDLVDAIYPRGRVQTIVTSPVQTHSFIPWTRPFTSQLIGTALRVIDDFECDAIVGWYLEPYGVAAAFVSEISKRPLILCHAGSDIGRLANHPDLRKTFAWALSRATCVVTNRVAADLVVSLGARAQSLSFVGRVGMPSYFARQGPSLDLVRVKALAQEWYSSYELPQSFRVMAKESLEHQLNPGFTTIGTYGKVGDSKGSYDLLRALRESARTGGSFNLLMVAGGSPGSLCSLYELLRSEPLLFEKTTVLPFLCHWRIPEFLRLCDVTCFLERNFPIGFHSPRVPQEILLAGSCLVCSDEIMQKQYFRDSLIDGRTYIRVRDPRETSELRARLERTFEGSSQIRSIASRGHALMRTLHDNMAVTGGYAEAFEDCLTSIDLH